MSKELTQELVRDLFNYDPDTGILTNKITRNYNAKAGDVVESVGVFGYLCVRVYSHLYPVHRICFLHYYGYLPPTLDHKDTNRSNNRALNLRECTNQQNSWNKPMGKSNTSGIKGVSWHRKYEKWRVQLSIDGKNKSLGYFADIEDARKVVEAARIKHHGDFANHG